MRLPRWTESIRFRLSLTYALAVFAGGAILIGGLYMYQVRQLDDLSLTQRQVILRDPATGQLVEVRILTDNQLRQDALRMFERNAYLVTLDKLRRGSLVALGALFFVAFGTGWLLAGWALRPVHRMTMVARDITATDLSRRIGLPGPEDEMKGLADTFDAMLDRLQAGFEDQRRFVQDASHELRNPLAAARANLELALSDPNAGVVEIRSAAEVAHRSTERMADMVDDLLIQARTGVPEVGRSEIDLNRLGEEIAEEFAASAKKRRLSIVVTEQHLPTTIRGDEPALRRAVSNLVSNAVRLAPEETDITIDVKTEGHMAVVSVTDEGPGIDAQHCQHVFERFWRGDESGTGTGLGLSIVQKVTERHGGVATVQSALGTGSTFSIKIPINSR